MTNKSFQLSDQVYDYLLSVSSRESPLQRRLREETAALPAARMQVAPEQAQLMSLLVQLMGVRQALEVGVFTGYSSLAVAQALPADGRLVACDVSREWTSIARRYWQEAGVDERIELRLGPALETLEGLLKGGGAERFDFCFIDADKSNYAGYYEYALQLLRPGGLILIDNTLWSGRVADPEDRDKTTEVIRAFNDKLHQDPRIELAMVPIADGLTLALKRTTPAGG